MVRIHALRLVVASVVLGIAGAAVAKAEGVAPAAPSTPSGGVYGGWATPAPGGYGTWTTPPSGGYGGWTTPRPSGYGTWTTPPASARALGAPSVPSTPASCDVVAPSCAPSRVVSVCAPERDACNPWSFGAFGRYWHPAIKGEVLITAGGEPGSGSRVDTQGDLNLGDADAFEVGVSVGYRRHRVFLAYEWDSFSGSSVLDRTIVYRGATYPAGEHVDSKIDLTFWKLGYDYAFVGDPTAKSGLTMRGGLAAWLWDYDGRLQGTDSGIDESRTFSHVLPVATLAAEGTFGAFHVAGRASGGLLASDRYVVDLEASVGVTLWKTLSLDVGYRWMNFAFHETTNEADLTLYGPFAGISLAF